MIYITDDDFKIFQEVKPNEETISLKEPVFDEQTQTFMEKEKFLEKKANEDRVVALRALRLLIDNYQQNAIRFYEVQPYFYDKAGIFWFWNYDTSKYEIKDDVDVMVCFDNVFAFAGQTVTNKIKNNTLEAMKRIGRERQPHPSKKKWVQFKDKAYSIFSRKIHKVTPDFFFTNPIPWELGDKEDTPIMDKLFEEWVGKDNVPLLYEIIAYCCYTDYPIHRIFCLVGSGSNGKSRYLALIERFLGDNICASELDDLINNRFESFKLYKKLCCVMGETNFGILNKTSLLKKLSGQDIIGFEKKNKDPFNDHNYAKIIISSNSLPVSDDNTDGFYRRWTIIDFVNQFQEGKDILEIIPPIEYNNLARKSVNILKRLLETGIFTNQGSISKRKEKYLLASNPISMFIKKHCCMEFGSFCNYGELYTLYIKYLNENKRRRIKSTDFKKALEDEGHWVEKTSKNVNDTWVSGYWVEGIKINEICANYDSVLTPALIHGVDIGNDAQIAQISEEIIENNTLDYKSATKTYHKCFFDACESRDCAFDENMNPFCEKHWKVGSITKQVEEGGNRK